MKPVCLIYSTFLQRAFDQIVHDVCLMRLPVVFAIDRAGLVGADGATHQGSYDISFLRPLPNMAILAPVTGDDLAPMLSAALDRRAPTAIRFPRGTPRLIRRGFSYGPPLAGAVEDGVDRGLVGLFCFARVNEQFYTVMRWLQKTDFSDTFKTTPDGLKLEQFGGMLPGWDDHLIPQGQAASSVNGYLFNGNLAGWRTPKLLHTLSNSAAKFPA